MYGNWTDFYQTIRDPSWPDCPTVDDITNLPESVVKEILQIHLKKNSELSIHLANENPKLLKNSIEFIDLEYEIPNNESYKDLDFIIDNDLAYVVNDITVYYNYTLDGGGTRLALNYIDVLKEVYPGKKFNNCFEWCAGPGFIGFSILANNLCSNLWLGDIYKPAINAINQTISNLSSKYANNQITAMHLSSPGEINTDIKFDLIVANPPHYDWSNKPADAYIIRMFRICSDNEFKIHENFFQNIKKNLAPDGIILLQEASSASGPDTFKPFIEENGLKITRCFYQSANPKIWYLEVQHA